MAIGQFLNKLKKKKIYNIKANYLRSYDVFYKADAPKILDGLDIKIFKGNDIVFYLNLYSKIGKKWKWQERLNMLQQDLVERINDKNVECHILYKGSDPIGFYEIKYHKLSNSVQLVYLGVLEKYIGQGFGGLMMDHAIWRANSFDPSNMWIHTCTLDHPKALGFYKNRGFKLFRSEDQIVSRY